MGRTHDKRESAAQQLDRLLQWIGRLDARVATLAAVDLGMMGYLTAGVPPLAKMTAWTKVVLLVAYAALAVPLWYLAAAAYPRVFKGYDSYFFFQTVASRSLTQYVEGFLQLTDEAEVRDLLEQCYRTAVILERRISFLRKAFRATFVAVVLWLLGLYVTRSPGLVGP